jgi:hypothetical protein
MSREDFPPGKTLSLAQGFGLLRLLRVTDSIEEMEAEEDCTGRMGAMGVKGILN